MMTYALLELITCLALFVYCWNFAKVGRARGQYAIKAPAVTGNPDFERVFRVQQNMLEQLVVFLPALWLFCLTLSPLWGAVVGAIWIVGRIIYSAAYYGNAEKRGPGFMIAITCSAILLIGAFIGSVEQLTHL
ncbi:MAG: MAPEG family protein [Aliidongia sp.]|jgi:glutathione S-transferase